MDYRGFNIIEEENRIKVSNVRDFNPVHIFECGQCFRWRKHKDDTYLGVAMGKVIGVRYSNDTLEIINSDLEDFKNVWFDYFDLGTDYGIVKETLSKDPVLKEAIKYGGGIRILKQELWETLISFIISANNRIPRIMRTVESISELCGDKIDFEGNTYYKFPGVNKLADTSAQKLEVCKGGFRCKYIVATANMVKNREVDLTLLSKLPTDEARALLTKFNGVGDKVADCTLLFSGTKHDVFPTDVWVKRIMEELYFKREANFREIQQFAKDTFGKLSGIAQQYLFYYARENRIGAK